MNTMGVFNAQCAHNGSAKFSYAQNGENAYSTKRCEILRVVFMFTFVPQYHVE
ncbi:hypothetical protein EXN66_Car009292 [Channa argus]|uniref:Uncharacterized protein n=1 Tax=Channa argus TaxID=215402 RepID=A0A6G1PUE7_CHAAH|nr:hypothetical protein EXN66_Car009292 [Channa argus]